MFRNSHSTRPAMSPSASSTTATERLLELAATYASQGRPAMAEAARRAAVVPTPPIEWAPRAGRAGARSASFGWTARYAPDAPPAS